MVCVELKIFQKGQKSLGWKQLVWQTIGVMFGSALFYQACQKEGIKAIIGCEVYVAPKSRFDKEFSKDYDKYNHLILLVKDKEGYQNLIKLVSIGFTEGFYSKPRIDKEVLEKYSKGLVCLSRMFSRWSKQGYFGGWFKKSRGGCNLV